MTYFTSFPFTDNQRQIIMGTILGGSSIIKPKSGRNCYLSMRDNNAKWLQCKAQELPFLRPENPYLEERANYFRWHSRCSPSLDEFREMFYEDGQKVAKMDVLDKLRDIGFAVWFGDAGYAKGQNVIIKTSSFKTDGTGIISQYFKEVGLDNNVLEKGNGISFTEQASRKFADIVHQSIPPFMISVVLKK